MPLNFTFFPQYFTCSLKFSQILATKSAARYIPLKIDTMQATGIKLRPPSSIVQRETSYRAPFGNSRLSSISVTRAARKSPTLLHTQRKTSYRVPFGSSRLSSISTMTRAAMIEQELKPLWDDGYGTQTARDFIEAAKTMFKPDGGPPRWFCPVECGSPLKNSPLLLYLPGT